MSFQPGPALGLLLLAGLYLRAVRQLGRRGYRVPAGQQAFWWTGWALLSLSFLGPLDEYAPKLVSAHMAQHVLMADIASPLMLIGVRNPVLMWFLPPQILTPLARRRRLRAAFAKLRSPMVAVPVYTLVLFAWHTAPLFEAALRSPVVHALQHESFIVFSVFLWWPVIEPQHRRMPGGLWKIPYIFGARLPTMFLGMAFAFSPTAFYTGFYGTGERSFGLSALTDQGLGGGIMMLVDIVIVMATLTVVFFRSASDDDAHAPEGEAGAQRDLAGPQQEAEVQAGRKVAEVR
jgi:putative membrane protein